MTALPVGSPELRKKHELSPKICDSNTAFLGKQITLVVLSCLEQTQVDQRVEDVARENPFLIVANWF